MIEAERPIKTLKDIWKQIETLLALYDHEYDNKYVDETTPSWWENTHVKLVHRLFTIQI